MNRHRRQTPRRRAARGFTLVEMLIVIGIVVLLLGLTLAVSNGLIRSSEVRQAENTLKIVDAAIQEWELAADRQIRPVFASDCDNPPEPLDVCFPAVAGSPNAPEIEDQGREALHELLGLLNRQQSSREILTRISEKFLQSPDDSVPAQEAQDHPLVLQDPWDAQVLVVFPAIIADPNTTNVTDDDGTPRTVYEDRFGIASNRRPYLVSAGPDGLFGNLHLDEALASLNADERRDVEDAADNVYTYPIIRKRP